MVAPLLLHTDDVIAYILLHYYTTLLREDIVLKTNFLQMLIENVKLCNLRNSWLFSGNL